MMHCHHAAQKADTECDQQVTAISPLLTTVGDEQCWQVLSRTDWWLSLVYRTQRWQMCRGQIFYVQGLGLNFSGR